MGQFLYLILQALKAIVMLHNLHYKLVLTNVECIMTGIPQPSEETRDKDFTLQFLLYLCAKLEFKKHSLSQAVSFNNLKIPKWVGAPLLLGL